MVFLRLKYPTVKRVLDISLAVILLVSTSPILFFISIIVWFDLGRPILFSQTRIGLNEVPFEFFKFRTMKNLYDDNFKRLPDSERVSIIGSRLRRMSLDELPSLFLVLIGKISLVGPRPLPYEYLERMNSSQKSRFLVKPGITGLAQIFGRTRLEWKKRLDFDVSYVSHQSISLDIKILLLTIRTVFSASGADSHEAGEFPWFSEMERLRNEK